MESNGKASERLRVLLVEDECLIAAWAAECLSEQGFAVQTASHAGEALRHLASAPVDVLVTDLNLPGEMDGAALAQRARELLPQLPVIYASARVGMLAPEARVPGALLLGKPYQPRTIARLIAAAARLAKEPAFG
jgi:CheY-like chemotaxis protein